MCVSYGVPQGSELSTVLFPLFMLLWKYNIYVVLMMPNSVFLWNIWTLIGFFTYGITLTSSAIVMNPQDLQTQQFHNQVSQCSCYIQIWRISEIWVLIDKTVHRNLIKILHVPKSWKWCPAQKIMIFETMLCAHASSFPLLITGNSVRAQWILITSVETRHISWLSFKNTF